MPVSFADLSLAFDFVSTGGGFALNQAFLCRASGEIYCRSDDVEIDEIPDDIEDGEKYIEIPNQKSLNLGKGLVLEFALDTFPEEYDKVERLFNGRGAYRRWKDFLADRGVTKQWYEFQQKAEEKALRAWCEENAIDLAPMIPAMQESENQK